MIIHVYQFINFSFNHPSFIDDRPPGGLWTFTEVLGEFYWNMLLF